MGLCLSNDYKIFQAMYHIPNLISRLKVWECLNLEPPTSIVANLQYKCFLNLNLKFRAAFDRERSQYIVHIKFVSINFFTF